MQRVIWGVLVVVAMLALATGCGDSDSDSLSKAEFVEQGNAICAKGEEAKNNGLLAAFKQLEKHKDPSTTLSRPAQEKLMVSVAIPPIKTMSEELAELEAPSEGAAGAEAIVEGFEAAIAEVEKEPSSVLSGESDPFSEVNQLAGKYGLEECTKI